MKLGVVGKGGTGKTTLSTLIGLAYVGRHKRVLAIDTDSNPNLALGLGIDLDTVDRAPLVPRSLVMGTGRGTMTPARLIADFGLPTPAGITLLHAMRVEQAGSGCTCTKHASVRSVLGAALEDECDVALVDMEAGLEHLARSGGTLAPRRRPSHGDGADPAVGAHRRPHHAPGPGAGHPPRRRSRQQGPPPEDAEFFETVCGEYGVPLAGIVPHAPEIVAADRMGTAVQAPTGAVRDAIEAIVDFVESPDAQLAALLVEKERIERRLADLAAG